MKNQEGFTLPELLVVTVITGFFIGLIVFFTVSYWRYSYLLEADLDSFITRLNAGDVLRESVGTSAGLIMQNGINDPHPNNPDSGNANYWEIIHAIPGTKSMPAAGDTTPLLYYRRLSFNSDGNIIMNGLQPYEDEYVLYLDGSSKQLMLRSLANPNASDNRLTTSCPPSIASSSCPADRIIATDIASVGLRYFSRSGNPIDWTSITDPLTAQYIGPDFTVVEVVEFTLNISKKPLFQKTNATVNSTIIRIALRND